MNKGRYIIGIGAMTLGILALEMGSAFGAGQSSAQFLKMGVGSRASAMGDTYVAVANDVTAGYWNPAGLTQIKTPELGFMQNSGLVDTNFQYLGAAISRDKNSFGVSVTRLDYGSIDRYTNANVKDGSFDAGSMAGSLSWGRMIRDDFRLGASIKYLQETIENETASGLAADLGFLYTLHEYTLGAAIQHMGPGLSFVQEEYALPMTFRVGGARAFFEEKLLLGLEASKARDNDLTYHSGVEYKMTPRVALRGGYKVTPSNKLDVDGLTGVTGGLGVNLGQFSLDYAFVPFGDLGSSHRFSFLIRFAGN